MSTPTPGPTSPAPKRGMGRTAQVIIVSSVMFTFISYWRTAAVVLCDLASTSYYIGGIVENAIGKAAPFFILAVMLFSYAVRSVYIESCSLFVRGGVYRVVKEAMGGVLGKLSVSALLFDYILTGPTSGVSAGQYMIGLIFQFIRVCSEPLYYSLNLGISPDEAAKMAGNKEALEIALSNVLDWRNLLQSWGSVVIAVAITVYFFRQNVRGLHESSEKALKIMIATTIMAVVMILWCLITLAYNAAYAPNKINELTWKPDLRKKVEFRTIIDKDPTTGDLRLVWEKDPATGELLGEPLVENGKPVVDAAGNPVYKPKINDAWDKLGYHQSQEDPTGMLDRLLTEKQTQRLREKNPYQQTNWLSFIGLIGLVIAFGHSILAMSGEETLAQVYREVESPKMLNFKKAAFVVFVYSLVLTAGVSFLAVLMIPDEVRMKFYKDNLIGGLTRYVLGPPWMQLLLEGFVVSVGFLILAGAVNTAIIGSNGVLNRVAEDGVLPDWFLKPHPRYGTTYRLLWLILIMQVAVIIFSGGDMTILGEAYAFGVVWSFVFKALAMIVLRYKDKAPREYKVPFNFKIAGIEIPFGLIMIFLILLSTALLNLFTKEVATIGGAAFTLVFFLIFTISERYHEKKKEEIGHKHEHIEQFNQQTTQEISRKGLGLTKAYRKLVSIRSTQNLYMLEKALDESDPDTTDVVVMTAKMAPVGDGADLHAHELDSYDQQLMTAVVDRAEKAGKQVRPVIVPTNNPLHAILQAAKDLEVQELILGASNKNTADEQLEQIAFYWISLHGGNPAPLTVRILTKDRDMYLDLAGGNRVPKISERRARSVAELRAAGVGVDKVMLVHDGSTDNSDLFRAVLTMLDPKVRLDLVQLRSTNGESSNSQAVIQQDQEQARQLGRDMTRLVLKADTGAEVVKQAHENQYDLIIVPMPSESHTDPLGQLDERARYIVRNAHCRVLLASTPAIPTEVVDRTPSMRP